MRLHNYQNFLKIIKHSFLVMKLLINLQLVQIHSSNFKSQTLKVFTRLQTIQFHSRNFKRKAMKLSISLLLAQIGSNFKNQALKLSIRLLHAQYHGSYFKNQALKLSIHLQLAQYHDSNSKRQVLKFSIRLHQAQYHNSNSRRQTIIWRHKAIKKLVTMIFVCIPQKKIGPEFLAELFEVARRVELEHQFKYIFKQYIFILNPPW